jgi:hypothetical protein
MLVQHVVAYQMPIWAGIDKVWTRYKVPCQRQLLHYLIALAPFPSFQTSSWSEDECQKRTPQGKNSKKMWKQKTNSTGRTI